MYYDTSEQFSQNAHYAQDTLTMNCTWLSVTNIMSCNNISPFYHVDSLFDQTTKSQDMQNSHTLLLIEMWQCSIPSLLVHNAFCFAYFLYMHSKYLAVWLVFCSERYHWCIIIIMQFLSLPLVGVIGQLNERLTTGAQSSADMFLVTYYH